MSRFLTLVAAGAVAVGVAGAAQALTIVSASNSTQGVFNASSGTRSIVLSGGEPLISDTDITIDFMKCDDPLSVALPLTCIGLGSAFAREIVFTLTSPSATSVNLVIQDTYFFFSEGPTPGARVTVTFDDSAATTVGGFSLVSGTFRPVGSLSNFNGENANGTWTLFMQDTEPGDPLGFASFTLNVVTTPEPGTLALLGLGIGTLGFAGRRRGLTNT